MSRRIPSVKNWQIKFYDDQHNCMHTIEVKAPTAVLAKLNALFSDSRNWFYGLSLDPSKITYTVIRRK